MRRTLALSRETLTELTSDDLAAVLGAGVAAKTLPVTQCNPLDTIFCTAV